MNLIAKLAARCVDGLTTSPWNKARARTYPYSEWTPSGDEDVLIRFFGTASFSIEFEGRVLVFDPYVTRPSARQHMAPLVPDEARIREAFPVAHDVFVSHAHSDHILDGPSLCAQNKERGARLIGSESVWRTGKAAGLCEDQLVRVRENHEKIASGAVKVTAVESLHSVIAECWKQRGIALARHLIRADDRSRNPGKLMELNGSDRGVLIPGETDANLNWPPYFWELKCGQVYDWFIDTGDLTIAHIASPRFKENQLEGLSADIVCLCAMNRDKGLAEKVIAELKPRVIIPCHWDAFIAPPDESGAMSAFRSAKIGKWMKELQALAEDDRFPWFEEVHLLRHGGFFGV